MSGHLAIIPARAVEDQRLGHAALRALLAFGRYTDRNGWCRVKQSTLAEILGVERRAVNKQITKLVELGYLQEQRTGRSSLYRVLLDTPADVPNLDEPMRPEVASHTPNPSEPMRPLRGASDAPSGGGIRCAPQEAHLQNVFSNAPSQRTDACTPERFEKFWSAYPARHGKKLGKGPTRERFEKLTYDEQRAAWIGAKNLAVSIAAGGTFGPPDPDRWLRDRRWEDWEEPAEVTSNGKGEPQSWSMAYQ